MVRLSNWHRDHICEVAFLKFRIVLLSFIWLFMLAIVAGAIWLLWLDAPTAPSEQPRISAAESRATRLALQPPKRQRPLIAIIGLNDATETTDYLTPYGVLKRANVADVIAVATEDAPVRLYPALTVRADATVAEFDRQFPEGADYIIVPAMSRDDDPAVLGWLRAQKAQGATIIAVCAGAKVVAQAGLLDGKRATTHWYYRDALIKKHPDIQYVPNRRWVVDDGIVTTTGISASMPMMLTLIEAITDSQTAQRVARDLGVSSWGAEHDSGVFHFNRPFALTVMKNSLALWNKERFVLPLHADMDEVTLALVADAWSRTYLSEVATVSAGNAPITTQHGLQIIPDQTIDAANSRTGLTIDPFTPPETALRQTLDAIAARYGKPTASVVAMQMEYPWFRSAP